MTLKEIQDFSEQHRIEVIVSEDTSYLCYIDYHLDNKAYSCCQTFFDALTEGIKNYNKLNSNPSTE